MCKWRDARGFSILEVLTAATLVATALVALAHLLILAGNASRAARAQSVAVLLAVGKLEELSSEAAVLAGTPDVGGDRVDASAMPFDDPARTGPSPEYERHWSTGPLPTDSSMLLLEVSVIPWAGQGTINAGPRRAAAVRLSAVKARTTP